MNNKSLYKYLTIILLISNLGLVAQTVTSIDLVPHSNKLDIVANSGCAVNVGFGPNPKELNGYNIRARGLQYLAPTVYPYPGINMICFRYVNGIPQNSSISIEYPFKANKTYKIHLNATMENNYDPQVHYALYYPVVWVKLESDPALNYYNLSPCQNNMYPIDRTIGTYSKLLAEYIPSQYNASFSLTENKNALVIILDPSPADPALKFDTRFAISSIVITELPYAEESLSTQGSTAYYNAPITLLGPKLRNNDPAYYIENNFPPPVRGSAPRNAFIATIIPEQWNYNSESGSYSVSVKSLYPDMPYSNYTYIAVQGDLSGNPRSNGDMALPAIYQNNSFSYEIINGELILNVNNPSGSRPINNAKFTIGGT